MGDPEVPAQKTDCSNQARPAAQHDLSRRLARCVPQAFSPAMKSAFGPATGRPAFSFMRKPTRSTSLRRVDAAGNRWLRSR